MDLFRTDLNPAQNLFLGRESLPIPISRSTMSKKYVPSFLKQGEPPSTATVANAAFDAFASNNKHKEKAAAFDAFPMSKRGAVRNENEFDAFSKVKKLPEVDAFSAFNSTRKFGDAGEGTSDAFAAFGSKTRGVADGEESHDFPMSKRTGENRPPKGDSSRGARNPHLVSEPMTYGGALISTPSSGKKAAAVVVVSGKPHGTDEAKTTDAVDDGSFAAKFATKMKITEDPSYVPPPTVVDMESEQDFPTLGIMPIKPRGPSPSQGWAQPLRSDDWTQPVQKAVVEPEFIKKTKKAQKNADKKIVPVVPRHLLKKQEEGKEDSEYKPIEYDEDAFVEDEALDASDLDEEALFEDDDVNEEDDELDPNVYENRRPDDLY